MASPTQPIQFHYADLTFGFPARTKTKEMILELIEKEGKKAVLVNYIFCSDAYLLALNQEYLKHNTLTDIITFQYHSGSEPLHSDIYISIERVRENARVYGVPFIHELHRVLFHGALHLCGFKDKTHKDAQLMRTKEDAYLAYFNVSRETNKK